MVLVYHTERKPKDQQYVKYDGKTEMNFEF